MHYETADERMDPDMPWLSRYEAAYWRLHGKVPSPEDSFDVQAYLGERL